MDSVLVTDGEERAALAVVRSLGRSGHRPYVCSSQGRSLAGASRYARAEMRVPSPLKDPERYAGAIERLAADWGIDTVVPITEASVLALLAASKQLAHLRIPFPDLERFRRISDKACVMAIAPEVGIAIPEQTLVPQPSALADLDATLRFPVVVKPSRSVSEAAADRAKFGVAYAEDFEELQERTRQYPLSVYPLLLQQRIVGPGVGIFVLIWEGEVVAAFSHRRLREKPPSGGVSVYRESIPADPELVAKSRALLARFDWQGVAMVEYKVDESTGVPFLMEINGRFWGSLQLAVDAGVDFPTLLVALATGERPEPVLSYRAGMRSRWWWGDVDHLLARMRRSNSALALPPGSPGRGRALLDFLKWRPGDRSEIFRWGDPAPFLRETLQWIRGK